MYQVTYGLCPLAAGHPTQQNCSVSKTAPLSVQISTIMYNSVRTITVVHCIVESWYSARYM